MGHIVMSRGRHKKTSLPCGKKTREDGMEEVCSERRGGEFPP